MTERFQLLEKVGQGGMGAVWKAKDTQTGDFLALKIPWEQYADDPGFLGRLEREVEVLRRIQSPHVVRVLGFGKREKRPFIAMELIEGHSLREVLRTRGPLPEDEVAEIIWQVACGLEDAHRANVLHRDVKPSNILMGGNGIVKVVDFGIAKATNLTGLTGGGETLGTAAYMPPEGEPSARADLYSLGCVAFELLTGSPPFAGGTISEVLVRHIREDADLTRLPAGARSIVGWMLRKRPEERPPTAWALTGALFPPPLPSSDLLRELYPAWNAAKPEPRWEGATR